MILFIKHIDIEGPGTLGVFFEKRGITSRTVDLGKGDALVQDTENLEAVISLGGPMNVYQEEEFPFLKAENIFIKKILELEIPFMGLCLGSQLLAKACDAQVKKSRQKEIGFFDIKFISEAKQDKLFTGLDQTIEVFQWHEDMSMVPSRAKLLASSEKCPHQAFKVGSCAYGLQFHVEITDLSIREWCDKYIKEHQENVLMKETMLNEYQEKKQRFDQTAEIIYQNFLDIINFQKGQKQ